jgi:hypothetical protein
MCHQISLKLEQYLFDLCTIELEYKNSQIFVFLVCLLQTVSTPLCKHQHASKTAMICQLHSRSNQTFPAPSTIHSPIKNTPSISFFTFLTHFSTYFKHSRPLIGISKISHHNQPNENWVIVSENQSNEKAISQFLFGTECKWKLWKLRLRSEHRAEEHSRSVRRKNEKEMGRLAYIKFRKIPLRRQHT